MPTDMNDGNDPGEEDLPGEDGDAREGNCLLLALDERYMLVPRNLVAQVLRYSYLEPEHDTAGAPAHIEWRGRRVPLLDDSLCGGTAVAPVAEDARVAVFHGLKRPSVLPFYGVIISRGPRLLRVGDDDIAEITDAELQAAELMRVRIDDVEAFIPKIDQLESSLIALLEQNNDG